MNKSKDLTSKSFLTTAIVVLIAATAFGRTTDEVVDKRIDQLFSGYNSQTPGVAVTVVKDGKTVFKKGYGVANIEHDVPITTKTIFQVASVSKQFTAFSIYLLEKRGKISFEDDVRKYFPEIPDFGKTIKVKHLLAHTSGIKDQGSLMTLAGWRTGDVTTTEDVLRIVSRQRELNFEPGSQFGYSNSGYTLLAEIVKRVSGQSFAGFTERNIFVPLGMKDTRFYDDFEKTVKNRADSYESENGGYKKKGSNNSAVGSTNLYTTAEDLTKWVLNFERPVVGDAELIRRFNEPSLLDDGRPVLYAVIDGENSYHAKGQFTRNYRGVNLLNHTGHDAGFRSYLLRFPDKKLSVIALSNDEHISIFQTGLKIAEFYLKDDLKPRQITDAPANAGQPVEKPNANLMDFEGKFYNDELETAYLAKVVDGKLIFSHIRHGRIELTETGKGKFSGKIGFPVEIEFIRGGNGAITGFRISNFGAKNVKFGKTNN